MNGYTVKFSLAHEKNRVSNRRDGNILARMYDVSERIAKSCCMVFIREIDAFFMGDIWDGSALWCNNLGKLSFLLLLEDK